ncbi:MAG TPA: redoxin domain-containing protein [Ignavibacteria bacterium]|nr:redoxin domain-containing protein [Ignavibacteria bacterium]
MNIYKNIKMVSFSISVLFIIISVIGILPALSENSFLNNDPKNQTHKNNPSDEAPGLKNKYGKWVNTDKEISMQDLKGKVVLIEFWTFGCFNCTNTLPYLNKWYEKYKSDDFEIIGIHCPEFDNERSYENVKASVEKLGIKYPVLTDNEFSIWKEYDVHAWPTIFLIDKEGVIRYKKVGEGKYDKTEQMINELLGENNSFDK